MDNKKQKRAPVIWLDKCVALPGCNYTFEIADARAIQNMVKVLDSEHQHLLIMHKKPTDKGDEELEGVCTVANILSFIQNGKKEARLTIEALRRGMVICEDKEDVSDPAQIFALYTDLPNEDIRNEEIKRAIGEIRLLFGELKSTQKMAPVAWGRIGKDLTAGEACDIIANIVLKSSEEKLQILETLDVLKRIEILSVLLKKEIEIMGLTQKIAKKVKGNIDKHQRDYFLREQMKVIEEELGDAGDAADLKKRAEATKMPEEVRAKVMKELGRMEKLSVMAPELSILRNYIENILELPWFEKTQDQKSLKAAREVLDADHYGIDDVKERIIEHIAVMQLSQDLRGQILCFVGPPGIGKTSIAESIARSIGRKFVRVSLGGVKDESEIRGHRKTYIGAMPGRIISALKKAKSTNPVFLLDEIDKMAHDHRGDPAAAMLEVLDPVQNRTFVDHFIEVPYDLGSVLFICTANDESEIPYALNDRLEIINLSSYTLVEKIKIAKNFLLPKTAVAHGIDCAKIQIDDATISYLVERYTREAGVRELSRVLSSLVRKIATRIVSGEHDKAQPFHITPEVIIKMLGAEKFSKDDLEKKNAVGVVNGLSYSTSGGDVLKLEVALVPGKGELKLTGNLGNIMKESAQIALSITKSLAKQYGIDAKAFSKNDIHIHVPGGAVPKDGPSAGVALVVALVSAFSGKGVRGDYALTGEVTLSGKVLEIGGVREKVISAYRYGIDKVILPKQNKKSLEKIPEDVSTKMNFTFAASINDVLGTMLVQ
jgi:ATP-dependent Lon protease